MADSIWMRRWYAQPNDLIGGWCVRDVDKPASYPGQEIADFTNEAVAQHIASLHNAWLATVQAMPEGKDWLEGLFRASLAALDEKHPVTHECEHQASNFMPCRICGV